MVPLEGNPVAGPVVIEQAEYFTVKWNERDKYVFCEGWL